MNVSELARVMPFATTIFPFVKKTVRFVWSTLRYSESTTLTAQCEREKTDRLFNAETARPAEIRRRRNGRKTILSIHSAFLCVALKEQL